jgi:hypothetical protein
VSGFGVQGLGFRVSDLGFSVSDLGFIVSDLGLTKGSGYRARTPEIKCLELKAKERGYTFRYF